MIPNEEYWKSYDMSDMPEGNMHPERYMELPEHLKAHATTSEFLPDILKEGIRPRSKTNCFIWPDERLPEHLFNDRDDDFPNLILQCREENVYFWDDYSESIAQALATVGMQERGDPIVLITNVKNHKLEPDPELPRDINEEPSAFMTKDPITPKDIECLCNLKDDVGITTAKFMCTYIKTPEECNLSQEPNDIWEELHDLSNWQCFCKNEMKV